MESTENIFFTTDLDDFKSRFLSSIQYIKILIATESNKVDKNSEHLINIYNSIDSKEDYINRLKKGIRHLIIMNDIINSDMNRYNNIKGENIFRLYPQIEGVYLEIISDEEFLSWFNVVIKNHISISKENINVVNMKQLSEDYKLKMKVK